MKNRRLTIGRARELIKRELGVSAVSLSLIPGMNDNPNFPRYSLNTGTRCIQVYTVGNSDGKCPNEIVALTVVHENSTRCFHEYFYADTLQFAAEYTESQYWNDLRETIEGVDVEKNCIRNGKEAREAWWKHCEQMEDNKND